MLVRLRAEVTSRSLEVVQSTGDTVEQFVDNIQQTVVSLGHSRRFVQQLLLIHRLVTDARQGFLE